MRRGYIGHAVEVKAGQAGHERKTFGFEIKSTSDDGSTGEGIASAFFNIDTYGDIVDDGAFDDTLTAFLMDGFIGGLNHDWDNPVGSPTKAEKVAQGLLVGWKISDTSHGKDVKILLRDKVVKKLSIGYQTMGREWLDDAEAVMAYWQRKGYTPSPQDLARAANGARLLTKIKLFEASPVTVPANDRADITSVKNGVLIETERDFERFLREAGFSRKRAMEITLHGWKAADQRDADEPGGRTGDKPDGGSSTLATETLRLKTQHARLQSRLHAMGAVK